MLVRVNQLNTLHVWVWWRQDSSWVWRFDILEYSYRGWKHFRIGKCGSFHACLGTSLSLHRIKSENVSKIDFHIQKLWLRSVWSSEFYMITESFMTQKWLSAIKVRNWLKSDQNLPCGLRFYSSEYASSIFRIGLLFFRTQRWLSCRFPSLFEWQKTSYFIPINLNSNGPSCINLWFFVPISYRTQMNFCVLNRILFTPLIWTIFCCHSELSTMLHMGLYSHYWAQLYRGFHS